MGQAKALVDTFWAAYESDDYGKIREIVAADGDFLQGGMRFRGPDELIPFLEAWKYAFPDLQHRVVNFVEGEGQLAIELQISGTQTGPMRFPGMEVPATGKQVTIESVDVVKVEGGKISSWRVYADQMALMAQLGLLPAPAVA